MSAPDLFAADGGKIAPMMAQYLAVKRAHLDLLLFYRMGDFYELFFDDAVAASRALDIALTKRGQHQGQDVPMCGVPVHSHTSYVARLIRTGFRVAICEQTETPEQAKKRGSKALVERRVIPSSRPARSLKTRCWKPAPIIFCWRWWRKVRVSWRWPVATSLPVSSAPRCWRVRPWRRR